MAQGESQQRIPVDPRVRVGATREHEAKVPRIVPEDRAPRCRGTVRCDAQGDADQSHDEDRELHRSASPPGRRQDHRLDDQEARQDQPEKVELRVGQYRENSPGGQEGAAGGEAVDKAFSGAVAGALAGGP